MRKIVLATTFLALLFLMNTKTEFFTPIKIVNCVESGTLVSGVVNTNTTWTLANSPYVLTGPVLVNRSVVLTIEAGVVVDFRSYFMQVDGELIARGTEDQPIRLEGGSGYGSDPEYSLLFTNLSVSWNEATNSGSIIDHAVINLNGGIMIEESSPRISNNLIKGAWREAAISVEYGSPLIVNNTILAIGTGIYVGPGSSPIIENNTISSYNGIIMSYGAPKIYRNKIVLNQGDGIWMRGSQPLIANNTISGNNNGLVLIDSPSPQILHNNIMGNKNYDVRLSNTPNDVNVTHNWWGTTDTSLIDKHIWDFYDDFRLGKVIYTPFLNAPSPGAPPWDGTPPTVDRIPPTIESIVRTPQGTIQPNQKVTISAKVTDADSGVKEVVLLYSLDGGASWINVTMNFNITSGFWERTIPGQPAGTQIQYQVIAYDNAGNYVTTPTATLQIPPNQNPPPSTPLTLLTIILVILFVISVIGITVLKLKKKNQPSTT